MSKAKKGYQILIADDHELILGGLKVVMQEIEQVRHVDIVSHKSTLIDALKKKPYDVLFLDIHFGTFDGREIATELKLLYPNLVLGAFTSFDDLETIQSTINAGFNAFFLKSDSITEIANWLLAADFEKIHISTRTKVTYTEVSLMKDSKAKNVIQLSDREKEILRLILDEKTTKEIAASMFLSDKTIENYRSNLLFKLDAINLAGLVKKTILLGLLN